MELITLSLSLSLIVSSGQSGVCNCVHKCGRRWIESSIISGHIVCGRITAVQTAAARPAPGIKDLFQPPLPYLPSLLPSTPPAASEGALAAGHGKWHEKHHRFGRSQRHIRMRVPKPEERLSCKCKCMD